MKKSFWVVLLSIVSVVVLVGIMLASSYNGLVNKQENVNNAWAQVQTSYQRRADLIPNLVQTVKGYANHENSTLTDIAKLRTGYQAATKPEEYSKLDAQLTKGINVVVEAYPELKANTNFMALQDELAGTENRIAVARRDFNQVATSYNMAVRTFPRSIVAKLFGFEYRELFKASEGADTAPTVDFNKK